MLPTPDMPETADLPEGLYVWRYAISPLMDTTQLNALLKALRSNDHRLLQGRTALPPVGNSNKATLCRGACPVGFCGLAGGLKTVAEVEAFFFAVCNTVAANMPGTCSPCRFFLAWWDESDREEARTQLADLIEQGLLEREAVIEAGMLCG